MAARSPARSRAGPEVTRRPTSSSLATIAARLVLPRPGGPENSRWSGGSPRRRADSSTTPSCSRTRAWPTNSSSRRGRRLPSPARSSGAACGVRMSVVTASSPLPPGAYRSPARPARRSPARAAGAGERAQRDPEQLLGGQLAGVGGQRLQGRLDLGGPVAEGAEGLAHIGVGGPDAGLGRDLDRTVAELALEFEDQAGGALAADAGDQREGVGVAGGDRPAQRVGRVYREDRQGQLGPDAARAD